jgi:hypothetical protein
MYEKSLDFSSTLSTKKQPRFQYKTGLFLMNNYFSTLIHTSIVTELIKQLRYPSAFCISHCVV